MLAQSNGLPADVSAAGCCSLSPSCPWARLAGVDGCLSEPYCLWFQLLARAYWGEVELGAPARKRGSPWARLRDTSRRSCVRSRAKHKDGRDQTETSATVSPGADEEPFSWPGPKTLRLRRTSQGFGFTLRHFIVYPPESAVHNSLKDDENGSRGRQRHRLEPMDTIFVKQVKEGGPAHGAGLCTGDRIIKVNGESIIGKTYSQVIALIQNSDASLELCVMPKDEDILQLFSRDITALAYSQNAYLKGNEAYSGNAQNIPEPPSMCYPLMELKTAAVTHLPEPGPAGCAAKGKRGPTAGSSYMVDVPPQKLHGEAPRAPAPPPDAVDRGSREDRAGPSHRTEENRYSVPPRAQLPHAHPPPVCHDTSSPVRAPVAVASSDSFSTTVSPTTNHHSPSPTAPAPSPHQNIDWRTYTTYKDYIDSKKLHTYGCRTIQERLDSLRAASNSAYAQQRSLLASGSQAGALGSQVRRRSASNERGGHAGGEDGTGNSHSRSASQERLGPAERSARNWPRSVSQDALPHSTSKRVPKPRARSCDHLGQQSGERRGLFSGDKAAVEEKLLLCHGEEAAANTKEASQKASPREHFGLSSSSAAPAEETKAAQTRTDGLIIRPSRLPVKNSIPDLVPPSATIKTTDCSRDQRAAGTGNHRGYPSPLSLHLRARSDSLRADGRLESGLASRSSSCSGASSKLHLHRQLQSRVATVSSALKDTSHSTSALQRTNGGRSEGLEGPAATAVVLRRDKISGSVPIRPPSYDFGIHDSRGKAASKSPPLVKAGSVDGAMCWRSAESCREAPLRMMGDSRPKLNNLDNSLDSIPFIDEPSSPSIELDSGHIPASDAICSTPLITTIPPSPISACPLIRHQLSHDQDSLHLAIIESDSGSKTERSKSFDEGVDHYHNERKGRSLLPGLKGLRKATDRSSEDSGSRRGSSSDVFCDATKEGLLHFKQLHTDKSKRGGGGIRPWKQIYAVLRGHDLCLYRDRKEGHANGQAAEEPLQISITACLIDISYSDTKRKNVLRLTTSDCEYLFQAEDREDMLAWIRVIQENSSLDEENAVFTSHDLISRRIKEYSSLMSPTGSRTEPSPRASRQSLSIRQTLLGGKGEGKATSPHSPKAEQEKKNMHKDETSPPKDKGTWRKGIPGLMRKPFEKKHSAGVTFGVRLDDCPPAHNNKFVPLIVEVCCRLVEERGLEYTGIYRVPGNNAAISNMQEELNNKGMGDIDVQDDKWRDLNVISSLLKSFFRKLPEPLFTNDRYADFIEANRIEDPVERLKVLKRLLHELPDHHYETLKFLSAHLKTVAENSDKNKMEPRNLAIVFGPTLVRTTDDNMTHMVTHMPDQYRIVETLIQNYDWFFTEDGNGDPVTVSQEESAVESQPVPNIDHLLTNIGRTGTPQGEVSDSPTSDSAKSKGSWGPGKDRELLVPSFFAAANRKRKTSREKPQQSSSDDDLDAIFPRKEVAGKKPEPRPQLTEPRPQLDEPRPQLAEPRPRTDSKATEERKLGRSAEAASKAKREHRNSLFVTGKAPPTRPSPVPPPSPVTRGKSSLSDVMSQLDENTSDLGTMSSGASVPCCRPRKWPGVASPDPPAAGGQLAATSAGAEVSSITSDYSTTSSITFPTGGDSSMLGAELQGGDDADDERSELVSEGRPMETDSEGEFPVFAQSTPRRGGAEGGAAPRPEPRRLFATHRMIECDTLSRRWSLRHKTDSDSSAEGATASEGRAESSSRLSRVLEVMKKGRSTSSISSSSRSESERAEPPWHLRITERLRLRLRSSADDVFTQKGVASRAKKKNIRRRHTMAGQRDFAELAVINDWREQGGVDQPAELPAPRRLQPRSSSQDRRRDSAPGLVPKATPEDDRAEAGPGRAAPPSGQVNGKAALGTDSPPHKLCAAHVARSRFYQYL